MTIDKLGKGYDFYKKNKGDVTSWVDCIDMVGRHLFTLDGQKIYNLFSDYPHELSPEEKAIFDKENPYWAKFFDDRSR